MKLTEIMGRLKGLVKKPGSKSPRPAKPGAAAAKSASKPATAAAAGKRAEVKRARKAAGVTRKRG